LKNAKFALYQLLLTSVLKLTLLRNDQLAHKMIQGELYFLYLTSQKTELLQKPLCADENIHQRFTLLQIVHVHAVVAA